MKSKKLISILLKSVIGIGSFAIIYWRVKSDFTPDNIQLLKQALFNLTSFVFIFISFILFPVNWAIESYKWKLITAQTQEISFKTAMRSVYAGICIGNLAPGRATEFLAKIHFFKAENKLTVTVLHFVNGMFQLSITIFFGVLSLFIRSVTSNEPSSLLHVASITLSIIVMLVFILILFNINRFVGWMYKRFNRDNYEELKPIVWSKKLLIQLFGFSIIRFWVFTFQFVLLLFIFKTEANYIHLFASIFIYFLFTTIIPMFSVIEAAVRTAIALIVFSDLGISNSGLAIVAILLWLINIVLPSVVGYMVLLKENLNFSSFSLKKQNQE
ncbi:MAG: lysylphosphatidylglycerol synthase domain-containing protein [Sphingobacteriaceae bacterium]